MPPGPRPILALASELDLPPRPSADELLVAAQACRALRVRLVKEHVRVCEAIEQLQAGFDDAFDDEGAAIDNRGVGADDEDEDDEHEDIERQRRHNVAESLVAGGDPDRLKRKEFLALCELEVVRAVLIPGFVAHGGSEAAAETIEQGGTGGFFIEVMKLLAALTMPVPPGSDAIARQRDCLRRVRSGIASDEVVSFIVSTVAPVASSRLEGPLPRPAAATIEVTLTLFNNVLKAPARECELVVGAMCRAHGIDLLLVILRQNHAKVEQALREAYNETGDEGEREVLRGLIGDGYAGTMAAEATTALAASLRGDDPRSSSRALDSDIDGLFNHGDSRAPRHSASRGSGESRIPFPVSPARPPSMQAPPGGSAQRPSSVVPGTPNRGTSSHGGTPQSRAPHSTEPDAADPVSRALLGTPRKSPKRPTVHQEMRKPASPMHRPVSSQQKSQEVPPPIPGTANTLPPIGAASTYLNVETQLAAGVLADSQAPPPPLSVADWVSSVASVRDPASADVGSSNVMSVVVPSPAPYTPAASAAFGGGSMGRNDDDDDVAETPAPIPPIPLASEHVDLSPPEIEVLGVDDAPATPAGEEDPALLDGNATSKALMSTPSRKSHASSSSPPRSSKQVSGSRNDSDDDEAALLGERRAASSAEATGSDEEDGLEVYAKQGGGPQDSDEEDEEDDEGNDDAALYDMDGNLIMRERDMKRDRVLAKLYADEKKRARGESMSALRRWNLVILEACALVFRSAPSATLATLGFGAEVSGSATNAAKKAIALRLSSQKVEMARWKDAVRRRQGATNSTALLVQRSDGPGSRLNAVGEANRTLQAKSELETAQELDARKRRIFRKKLLQANADDGSTSMLPLQTQVSLAGHYRQFAQFGFANLSSMLWPELQGRISSIVEGLAANRDAAQAIKDNNEGPIHNALDEIQVGDVLNYCALATTMLRFGRVTLRLRQATITGEARDMMLGGGGGAETQQREDAAVSLVDQALLPIATEVLTTSRLANAVTMLDVLQTDKKLQKKHDYLIALGYVGELLRVLVHSVDGELADSEPVRLAATSLASTLAFDPECMRTVLASTNQVLHASASIRQIETTLRAIHAAMLLLDRVSFGGKVQQEVRNKRGDHRNGAGSDSDDDGEGMVAPTMPGEETLAADDAETLPNPDDDTQLPPAAREATPPRQVVESGLAADDGVEDTVNDAAIAADGTDGDDGNPQQRIGNVVVDADGNATIAPAASGEDSARKSGKKSKKPKAEPKTEKSVQVTSFFQQLVSPKRLAVFLHGLRLWRQLADDVIEALVFFLEAFRHDEVRAEPVFFSIFAIIPFNDILHAREEAPPALFNVAMAYMRDFWGQVSTTYEMEMRCVRTLLPLDQTVHWQAVAATRDPVLRELVEGAVDSMTRQYRTEGAAAGEANHELMGYTTYDDEGNPIERTFDEEEEPDQRKPKRRRARTRRAEHGDDETAATEAPLESVVVPEFDEAEAMNAAVVLATQTLGEEADPEAIFTQAEDIVARERAAHDARVAEAAKGKARKPRAKRAPAAKKSTAAAEPKAQKSQAEKKSKKKKHRTEGDEDDEDDMLLGLADEGVVEVSTATDRNKTKSTEVSKTWLNADGTKKPKSELSKAERKAYKKYKKAKKEKKAAKLSAKAAKRKQRAEAGLADTAMTQELFSATQMASYNDDGDGDDSSSASSEDEDDALLDTQQAGGATQTLASFVESPSAVDGAAQPEAAEEEEEAPSAPPRTGISDAVFED